MHLGLEKIRYAWPKIRYAKVTFFENGSITGQKVLEMCKTKQKKVGLARMIHF